MNAVDAAAQGTLLARYSYPFADITHSTAAALDGDCEKTWERQYPSGGPS